MLFSTCCVASSVRSANVRRCNGAGDVAHAPSMLPLRCSDAERLVREALPHDDCCTAARRRRLRNCALPPPPAVEARLVRSLQDSCV